MPAEISPSTSLLKNAAPLLTSAAACYVKANSTQRIKQCNKFTCRGGEPNATFTHSNLCEHTEIDGFIFSAGNMFRKSPRLDFFARPAVCISCSCVCDRLRKKICGDFLLLFWLGRSEVLLNKSAIVRCRSRAMRNDREKPIGVIIHS